MGKSTQGRITSPALSHNNPGHFPLKTTQILQLFPTLYWCLLCFLSPQLIDYCSCDDKVNYRDFLLAFPSNLFPEAEGQDQQIIAC